MAGAALWPGPAVTMGHFPFVRGNAVAVPRELRGRCFNLPQVIRNRGQREQQGAGRAEG